MSCGEVKLCSNDSTVASFLGFLVKACMHIADDLCRVDVRLVCYKCGKLLVSAISSRVFAIHDGPKLWSLSSRVCTYTV